MVRVGSRHATHPLLPHSDRIPSATDLDWLGQRLIGTHILALLGGWGGGDRSHVSVINASIFRNNAIFTIPTKLADCQQTRPNSSLRVSAELLRLAAVGNLGGRDMTVSSQQPHHE